MNPSPDPAIAAAVPAEWWQILAALGPLAVLLGAVLAALLGWRTLGQRTRADARALDQKTEADNRGEWWKRTQWALDKALDEDEDAKALGLASLAVLARSDLARAEELELLDIAWQSVIEENGGADTAEDSDAVDSGDSMRRQWNDQHGGNGGGQAMSTSTPEQKKSRAPQHVSKATGKAMTPSEHRVQVAAARLRVALDERLGRPTPPRTKALSEEDF